MNLKIWVLSTKTLQALPLKFKPEFKIGETTAIVGKTGSGKSTLKYSLGLIKQTHGDYLLDSEPINDFRVTQLRREIGYVPQDLIMIDATVAENIAFGIPFEKIDFDALEKLLNTHK